MTEFFMKKLKDLGLQQEVMESLPYDVVGGAWEGSFENPMDADAYHTALNHIVPAGQQLKLLFLRVWTQETTGARFSIVQTDPATGVTGNPVVGSVPSGVRDYPMLEAAGAEVLRGGFVDPVHVLEGSIDFRVLGPTPTPATEDRYSVVWWGVEALME